jgi:NitT/TauT family transport system substrate-binding protein
MLRKTVVALAVCALVAVSVAPVLAQEPKVIIAMSGWTGFVPLTLAEKAGLEMEAR